MLTVVAVHDDGDWSTCDCACVDSTHDDYQHFRMATKHGDEKVGQGLMLNYDNQRNDFVNSSRDVDGRENKVDTILSSRGIEAYLHSA